MTQPIHYHTEQINCKGDTSDRDMDKTRKTEEIDKPLKISAKKNKCRHKKQTNKPKTKQHTKNITKQNKNIYHCWKPSFVHQMCAIKFADTRSMGLLYFAKRSETDF